MNILDYFTEKSSKSNASYKIDGKYYSINDDELCTMMENYCNLLSEGKKVPEIFELPNSGAPLFIEFKLENDKLNNEIYGDNFIMALVSCCQQTIVDDFYISDDQSELFCVVLESEKNDDFEDMRCSIDNSFNDKLDITIIRLIFPLARVTTSDVANQFLKELAKTMKKYNVYQHLQSAPNRSINESLSIKFNEFPLYGYEGELFYVYSCTLLAIDPEEMSGSYEKPSIDDSIIKFEDYFSTYSSEIYKDINECDDSFEYLPIILSASYYDAVMRVRTKDEEEEEDGYIDFSNVKISDNISIDNDTSEYVESMCTLFLNMLNEGRYRSLSTWIEIGKAIFNSYDGNEEGFNIWYERSMKIFKEHIPDFTKGYFNNEFMSTKECMDMLYNTFSKNNYISYATLAWYALKDSPKKYAIWHHNWTSESILYASYDYNDKNISRILYRILWLEIMYSQEESRWFFFRKHRWYESKEGIEIKKLFSSKVANILDVKRLEVVSQQTREQNNSKKKSLIKLESKLFDMRTMLMNGRPKNKLLVELKELCVFYKLSTKRDKDIFKIGVSNGVLDFSGDSAIFRDAKPEDFVTKSVRYNFKEYNWSNPGVVFIMDWFNKLFPDSNDRDYFLKLLAYCFVGANPKRIIAMIIGYMGSEGKSELINFLAAIFGDYKVALPPSLYKDSPKTGAAVPELARTEAARVGVCSEITEEGEELNDNMAKRLAGNDVVFARQIYCEGIELIPMFIQFFISNIDIVFKSMDSAMADRIVIFNLITRWLDLEQEDPKRRCPSSKEEQDKRRIYPRDENFPRKIVSLASQGLWILTQYHFILSKEGLVMSKNISYDSKQYVYEQDVYYKFIKNNVVEDINSTITLQDLYDAYTSWLFDENPNLIVKTKKVFRQKMIIKLGRTRDDTWKNYRIITKIKKQDEYEYY